MHMDTVSQYCTNSCDVSLNSCCVSLQCPCGSHWCFLCGKESGRDNPQQCPRGEGTRTGCDMHGIYLERLNGWWAHI